MLKIRENDKLAYEHFICVRNDLKNTIKRILKDNGLYKKINNTRTLIKLNRIERFYLYYLKQDKTLEYIICADVKRIKNFLINMKALFPAAFDREELLYKCIFNIFVTHGYSNLNKYEFINNIDLKSCPYCNRTYIFTLSKNKELKPEIDHFYPKSLYPIAALSFYNLIPSCPTCNGFTGKGEQDTLNMNVKNPYIIEYDDFKFNFNIKSMNILNPLTNIDEDSIEIYFEKEIIEHNNLFGLNILYAEHRDIVIELYIKYNHEYVRRYIDYLHSYEGLEFSDEEIYRLITCGYKNNEDLHKRPLSKLIKDISEELDLI